MLNISLASIVNKNIAPLQSATTLQEALAYMESFSISSVVIVDEHQHAIGIFTEHDTLKAVAQAKDKTASILEFMSHSIFALIETTYIHDAYVLMQNKGFKHLVVTDSSGHYLGVVSEGDFLRNMGLQEIKGIESVKNFITEALLLVSYTQNIKSIASSMNELRSDYAILMDESTPKGIITQRDITKLYTQEDFKDTLLVSEITLSNMHLVEKSISLQQAALLMENHGVHQLIVVTQDKKLLGLITRENILRGIHGEYFEFLVNTIEKKNKNEHLLEENKRELENKTIFLHTVVNTIPDLVWLKDIDGNYMACNTMFERFFGVKESEMIGKNDYDFVNEELANIFRENDKKALYAKDKNLNEEYLVFADGSHEGLFETIKTPMRNDAGEIIGILGIAHDITERKQREDELEKLANYDTLTNLPNRTLFKTYLQKSIANAIRKEYQIALVMFDLDRFKEVNDSYGHSVGDDLLKEVALRLYSRLRKGDSIARLGGDEFAIILEHINSVADAISITTEILESLSLCYTLSNDVKVHVGSSAGIVLAPKDGNNVEELMQYADSALYKAKNEGLGLCRYYTDEMTLLSRQKIAYENQLRTALENNELELYYQPQVHLGTGKIVGAEALIRWNHPNEGFLSPDVFIPIAEDTGLINAIGEWVLFDACRQGKEWLDMGHRLTIAVNVSANQVKFQNIPLMVEQALNITGYEASRLEIELTESALMQREEASVGMLHELRAKGIRLAIDDFGTGYSSLSYLKRFPIDVLKIDKSFIDDIPYEKDDMAIVIAIIEMGKALGYQVLAEGVELIEQLEFLKEKGCAMYQGYYKSKPICAKDFLTLLQKQ
jgi:diguanylate cyclase (GGDEF)-like protein/PAS domain S-box-containing protein